MNDELQAIANELILLRRLLQAKTLSQIGDVALAESEGRIYLAKREPNNVVTFQEYNIATNAWANKQYPN